MTRITLAIVIFTSLALAHHVRAYNFAEIVVPGGSEARATGINNAGLVVGTYKPDGVDRFDIFARRADGTISTYTLPNGFSAQTHRVNDLNQLAGLYTTIDTADKAISFGYVFDLDDESFRTYAYPDNDLEPDAAITEVANNGTRIVGWYDTTPEDFVYRGLIDNINGGSLQTVAGTQGFSTFIWGTNDAGVLVGRERRSAFVSSNATDFTFFQIEGNFTTALDVNNHGEIVGSYFTAGFANQYGFIRTIDGTLTTLVVPDSVNTEIDGINDLGTIVGSYEDAAGNTRAFVAVVPEPATLPLLAAAGVVALRRGRRLRFKLNASPREGGDAGSVCADARPKSTVAKGVNMSPRLKSVLLMSACLITVTLTQPSAVKAQAYSFEAFAIPDDGTLIGHFGFGSSPVPDPAPWFSSASRHSQRFGFRGNNRIGTKYYLSS